MTFILNSTLFLLFALCPVFGQSTEWNSDNQEGKKSARISSFASDSYARYKHNKTLFNYKDYIYQKSDPYNPGFNGVLSFVIPGAGHLRVGEYGRGFAFLGAAAGCFSLYPIGFNVALNNYELGRVLAFTGLASLLAIDIWSAVDATRVVKVNNLAWRDKDYLGYKAVLKPFINTITYNEPAVIQTGLSIRLSF